MKKGLCLLTVLMLLSGTALADLSALRDLPGTTTYVSENAVDLVTRYTDQLFLGTFGEEVICGYLDFLQSTEAADTVFLRLTICVVGEESLDAEEMTVTCGKKSYTFERVDRMVSEYDTMYYEDYSVCLTDESIALIKAIASSKSGELTFSINGAEGTLTIPPAEAKAVLKDYESNGGTKQDLKAWRELWPVVIH